MSEVKCGTKKRPDTNPAFNDRGLKSNGTGLYAKDFKIKLKPFKNRDKRNSNFTNYKKSRVGWFSALRLPP